MDNLVAVKIPLPNRKRRIGRKVFERKLRKLAEGWHISEGNETTAVNFLPSLKNERRKKVHFNVRDPRNTSFLESQEGKMFRPLDDVARKLLDMSVLSNINAQPNQKVISKLPNTGKSKLQNMCVVKDSWDKTVEAGGLHHAQRNKILVDEGCEEMVQHSDYVYSATAERLVDQKDELSDDECEVDRDSNSPIAEENKDLLNETDETTLENDHLCSSSVEDPMEETLCNVEDDGHHSSKLDDQEECGHDEDDDEDDGEEEVVESVQNNSTLDYPIFSRYNFKSTFSPFSKFKQSISKNDDALLVVDMVEPGPKPYLLAKPNLSTSKSTALPFPYTDSSETEPTLGMYLKDSALHKTISSSHVDESASAEIGRSYIFHVLSNDRVLLGLKYPHALYFRGKLHISVVFGSVEVHGYEMKNDGLKTLQVYSPRGMSLFSLSASQSLHTPDYSRLADFGLDLCKIDEIRSQMSNIDCLLLLENKNCPLVDFISDHFPLKLFPSRGKLRKKHRQFHVAEDMLHCKFVPSDMSQNLKLFIKQPEWETCIESISKTDKIRAMVCGGKSVGKSTFLRFLVNRYLIKYKSVLYLDFDPGQSEFTVPGCVSVVLVKEPLLGPNYFHLHHPCRMIYIGEINVSRCPVRYLESVQQIIEFCHSQPQFSNIPWFINTMGFNKGLGVELIVNIIRMVGPSDVLQIQSTQKKRNFPELLESTYVCDYQSSLTTVSSASYSDLAYDFYEIPSGAEESHTDDTSHWGMQAHKLRDLVILSYLSKILLPSQHFLSEVVPFRLPFSKLKLCVCHEAVQYSQYLAAMNCNLVALCSVGDEFTLVPSDPDYPRILLKLPVCPCLGFGVVRGIDLERKELYLISPLSEKELSQVNCLVLGPVTLPSGVLFKTNSTRGQIPYVTIGDGQPTGQNMRRSRSVIQLHKKRKAVR